MEPAGNVEFIRRSWPADPENLAVIRRELAAWLAPLHLTAEATDDVVLAVDEAVANAVRHAYGPDQDRTGPVDLTLWTEAGCLSIEVVDHGSWRAPDPHPPRGGLGIPLMTTVAESVLIHYDERGSRVLLRYPLPEQA